MTDDFRRDQRSSRRFGGSGDPSDGSDREDDEDASRRVGGGNNSDPPDDDDDGPRTSGGSPSVPGTIPDDPPDSEPDPPDDDPDPSPGPSSPGGSPSVPGGSDPEPPEPEPSDPSPEASTGSSSPTGTDREDDQDASQRVGGSGDPDDAVDQPDALDRAARTYTEGVSEPIGDVVADASPITAAEQSTLGTNRSGRFFESAGETVAEFGNAPGIAAEARDTLQGRAATQDPVSAGPFVASAGVLDFEGRERQARETTDAVTSAASTAADNPFSAAGIGFGALAGGAGVARAASRASRVSGTTSRSGSRTAFDEFVGDTRAQADGGRLAGRTTDDVVEIDADDIDPRQVEPDQGPAAFPDPQGRFQGGAGFRRGGRPDTDTGDTPASVDPSGSGDGFNFRSASTETRTAQAPPRADSPLGPDLRATPGTGTGSGATGTGVGTAAGLGAISGVNDPTGIADNDTATGVNEAFDTAADADSRSGFGVSALGEINDPTGIVSDSETAVGLGGRGTGVDTLGTIGTVNDQTDVAPTTETDTDVAFDTETNTDTGLTTFSDTDTGTTTDTTETTTTDTTTTATTPSTPRTPPTTNNNDRFRLDPTDELGQTAGDGGLDGLDAVGETFENPTRSLDQVSQDLLEDIDGP